MFFLLLAGGVIGIVQGTRVLRSGRIYRWREAEWNRLMLGGKPSPRYVRATGIMNIAFGVAAFVGAAVVALT